MARPLRLGALARAISAAGRTALVEGAELRRLSLSIAVSEPPALDPTRLWGLRVLMPAPPPPTMLPRWLASKVRPPVPEPDWPRVRLTWEAGAIYAALEPPSPDPVTPNP